MLAVAGSAHAGPKDFVIFTPGLGGDAEQAKPYIEKFAGFLDGAMGWPKGSAKGTFLGSRKEAVAAIDTQKPGFGVMEASLYLDLRKPHKAEVLAQVDSAELNTTKLHLVVKNPAYKSLADLAGKRLWTTLADSPKYLSNVILDGKGAAETRFVLKQVGVFSKGVRAVLRGEADATLVNDEQLEAAKKMEGGGELRSIYDSPPLPALVVVALAGALPAAEAQKLAKTLIGMCGQPAGGAICKEMHISRFVPTNTAVLTQAQQRFEHP
jgi:ABC-type phosphate/phosphonate transport system substrate-binding protein